MYLHEYELKVIYEMKKGQYEKEALVKRMLNRKPKKKIALFSLSKWFKKEMKQNPTCCA